MALLEEEDCLEDLDLEDGSERSNFRLRSKEGAML